MLKQSPQLFQSIEKSFNEQKFDLCYFFFGEEEFLVKQAVSYLRSMALHGCEFEFNDTVFDGENLNVDRLLEEVQMLPMMFARRFVEVKNADRLKDAVWKEIIPYLEKPLDSVVFLISGAKLDKRKSGFLKAQELCTSVEFRKPFENQIPGWIKHLAQSLNLEIEDDAVLKIQEYVGSQLVDLDAELQKLRNYVGDKKQIRVADVESVVTKQKQWNVFELIDMVAAGQRDRALISVIHLLDQGQNELGVVSLLFRHYRILTMINRGEAQGFTGAKLAQFAQVFPKQLDQYLRQARAFSHTHLEQAVMLLSECEKAIKSSPLSSHLWIENLVLRLTELRSESAQLSR